MNDDELDRKVRSIGKSALVIHFDLFRSYFLGTLSKQQVIEQLVELGVSNESGAAIRCSNAILVFRAGREFDALQMVLDSKVDNELKIIAEQIIKDAAEH